MPAAFRTLTITHNRHPLTVRALAANAVVVAEHVDLSTIPFEALATAVAGELDVALGQLVWVEYVPARSKPAASAEAFSLVQFGFDPTTRALLDPRWRAVSRAQVEALLGQAVPARSQAEMTRSAEPPALTGPVLPEDADTFLDEILGDRPRSRTTYRASLRVLQEWAVAARLTPTRSPLPARTLTNDSLARFFGWMRRPAAGRTPGARGHRNKVTLTGRGKDAGGRVYADATIALHLTVATRYVRWLDSEGRLSADVSAETMSRRLKLKTGKGGIEPKRREAPQHVDRLFGYWSSEAESVRAGLTDDLTPARRRTLEHKILECLRNEALIRVLYTTAARVSEILRLRKRDLRRPLPGSPFWTATILGKGQKDRQIYVDESAIRAIAHYLQERESVGDGRARLWPSHNPRRPSEQISAKTAWAIVRETADAVTARIRATDPRFPKIQVGPHLLRHARAQALANAGMRLDVLQTLLGHEDISTTRRSYAQHTPDAIVMDQLAQAAKVEAKARQAGAPSIEGAGFSREIPAVGRLRRRREENRSSRVHAGDFKDLLDSE